MGWCAPSRIFTCGNLFDQDRCAPVRRHSSTSARSPFCFETRGVCHKIPPRRNADEFATPGWAKPAAGHRYSPLGGHLVMIIRRLGSGEVAPAARRVWRLDFAGQTARTPKHRRRATQRRPVAKPEHLVRLNWYVRWTATSNVAAPPAIGAAWLRRSSGGTWPAMAATASSALVGVRRRLEIEASRRTGLKQTAPHVPFARCPQGPSSSSGAALRTDRRSPLGRRLRRSAISRDLPMSASPKKAVPVGRPCSSTTSW